MKQKVVKYTFGGQSLVAGTTIFVKHKQNVQAISLCFVEVAVPDNVLPELPDIVAMVQQLPQSQPFSNL